MRIVALLCSLVLVIGKVSASSKLFPESFQWGVATAAYQIEGAWNVGGKAESIWDRWTHSQPNRIFDGHNADEAADSYHLYKTDVALLKDLGVQFYRFSISWPRILSDGLTNNVNEDGIRYYNNLIDELIEHNITALVTMYHWDLPQYLDELGGWTNPVVGDYFVDYAKVLFERFGDRVTQWITFNEPKSFCVSGYDYGNEAPGRPLNGVGSYLCAHNVILAHAKTYKMYVEEFKATQKGRIGITLNVGWGEPENINDPKDVAASERGLQFSLGWYAHPIFSAHGDYPAVMRKYVDSKSRSQGFSRSRLPNFTAEEIEMVRGSADFLGLNHYTSSIVRDEKKPSNRPSYGNDMEIDSYENSSWPSTNSTWIKVVPWGFRKVLNWIKREYSNPIVLVTENGVSTVPGHQDVGRVEYLHDYLSSLLDAIVEDGCRVVAYTYWSLIDNFEWTRGFSERFGLYEVDFASPNKTRTPRDSAAYYAYVIKHRRVPTVSGAFDDDQPLVVGV